jgi:spore maturation protein CgeB
MNFVLFCHALTSCWNNGNAHFLRGIARELRALGHAVTVYEPRNGWSRLNAISDGGIEPLQQVQALLPGVDIKQYGPDPDLDQALDGVDVVLVHEWNSPGLIAHIGRRRIEGGSFTLLFHDTHHRAVTAQEEIQRFDLQGFDGVLAFGEVLRQIYLRLGWANRAFTWHEAADTGLYRPHREIEPTHDVIWIGNWGDNERSAELNEFLLGPVAELGLRARIHGVRYSLDALRAIEAAGIEYCGWLPAHRAPFAFAGARATVHVPRGPYARSLPGIPTIRMFEAMACGIPIVSAPWDDAENLFLPGSYLRAADGVQMKEAMLAILRDHALATDLVKTGLETIRDRHTCRHRAAELIRIVSSIRGPRHTRPASRFEGVMS